MAAGGYTFGRLVEDLRGLPGVHVRSVDDSIGAIWLEVDDVARKVDVLNALARFGSEHEQIQALALALRRYWPDDRAYVLGVQRYLQKRIRWVDEPEDRFALPWVTLTTGAGDCDDSNTLGAAVLLATGVRADLEWIPGDEISHLVARAWLQDQAAPVYVECSADVPPGTDPRIVMAQHAKKRQRFGDATQPFPQQGGSSTPMFHPGVYLPASSSSSNGNTGSSSATQGTEPLPKGEQPFPWSTFGKWVGLFSTIGAAGGAAAGAAASERGKRARGAGIGAGVGAAVVGVLTAVVGAVSYSGAQR